CAREVGYNNYDFW
nr:immunoglobulin heavy chain junction region [Macaca mulatta]MOW86704.1 immunoglobulin heavy chain junction region [Macaca mulatta]MOW86818.1 immunoglobulin heavy chain junction region [Macaca mulatta]MOW86902.1 immunoglobulin heavy chain junction region [Macaca mulatta]MOW87046.1 immunoglobulin heavy chain junction region [Macaca mulatta]